MSEGINNNIDTLEKSKKLELLEEDYQKYLTDNYYNFLHKKIIDYLVSGKMHSTLVGIIIDLDGSDTDGDKEEAIRFADYIINFLKKVN